MVVPRPEPHHDHDNHDDPDAPEKGMCEPLQFEFRHLPVHVALLRTGKVLAFGGSGNDRRNLASPLPAELWDPATGETKVIDQELDGDIFCAGHSFLPDGRLLIAGGTHLYEGERKPFGLPIPPFRGLEQSYQFDPVAERWIRVPDLLKARWYPTLITLGDGRVLAMAGLMKRFPWVFRRAIEIYTPGSGWRRLEGADRWLPLYPRLHLLPSGEVFYAGSFNTHYTFPFTYWAFPTSTLDVSAGRWRSFGLPNRFEREEGTSVLMPLRPPDYRPRVLLFGGGPPKGDREVTNAAETIDPDQPSPRWRAVESMRHPRYYVYPVILPDGRILAIGGRSATGHMPIPAGRIRAADLPHDPLAVLEIEMFDPKMERWKPMAKMQVDRLYHANALLLPDGRVFIAGSNPQSGVDELRIEIYRPPYLFRGPRPRIEEAPEEVSYGEDLALRAFVPDGKHGVDEVVLIRPTSTTHCVDTDQRLVGLQIKDQHDGRVVVEVPHNPNVAPPGHYMLFVLCDDVPSVARFVRVH